MQRVMWIPYIYWLDTCEPIVIVKFQQFESYYFEVLGPTFGTLNNYLAKLCQTGYQPMVS